MKKSRVFRRSNNKDIFRGSLGGCSPMSLTALESQHIVIPKKAKRIQLICTVKKTANSFLVEGFCLRSDFTANTLPKEKWCHVVWW